MPVEPKNLIAISGNDSADLSSVVRRISASGAGVIKVDTVGGDTNISLPIAAGQTIELQITRVYSTGTTATGIAGYYD